jgi:dGTP triphosphohydrolase
MDYSEKEIEIVDHIVNSLQKRKMDLSSLLHRKDYKSSEVEKLLSEITLVPFEFIIDKNGVYENTPNARQVISKGFKVYLEEQKSNQITESETREYKLKNLKRTYKIAWLAIGVSIASFIVSLLTYCYKK